MSFFLAILIFFVAELGLKLILLQFISNIFLVDMIFSLSIAFLFPIFMLPRPIRKSFYKLPQYHRFACTLALILLGMDLVLWII